MVASMSFNAQMTPAQRAQMDSQRLKARQDRLANSPGPGMYETRQDLGYSGPARPSSAFRSKTVRTGDVTSKDVGDPGAYNPYGADTFSNKSFNKSQQSGAGFFGSTAKRGTLNEGAAVTPGPGAYDVKELAKPEAKQSSAFASQSKRGSYLTRDDSSPGVGTYSPKFESDVKGVSSTFKSSEPRFREDTSVRQLANLGPGSYSQEHGTVGQAVAKAAVPRPGSASFGTSSKREALNLVTSDVPGPGAYEAQSSTQDARPSAAFKSKSQRQQSDPTNKDVGDPGAYDPYGTGGIGSSQKSFNKSIASGASGFGTTTKRSSLATVSDVPGPGAYDIKDASKPEAKQSSAFASQSKRGSYIATTTESPGVGTYSPKVGSAPSGGGVAAFKSTEHRFKDDKEVKAMKEVGPGTYSQDTGTLAKSVKSQSGKLSLAFASTSLRDSSFP